MGACRFPIKSASMSHDWTSMLYNVEFIYPGKEIGIMIDAAAS